ncbi:MAG: hypothetical protein AAGF12_13125 [Myxococcota bacterium]
MTAFSRLFLDSRLILLVFSLCLGLGFGCGHANPAGTGTVGSIEVPERITAENYGEYSRILVRLPLDDASRPSLRDRLVAYLVERGRPAIDAEDYPSAVATFAEIAELYSPEDVEAGRVSEETRPLAEFIVQAGSPLGDEGRVLASLYLLQRLDGSRNFEERYERLAEWGRDARATLPGAITRYSGLIDVWEEHARLSPAPEVLTYLARLHMERRDEIVRIVRNEGPAAMAQNPRDLRLAPMLLRRAPLDVAAIFLRHGDVASAISHVESMGDSAGIEAHLVRLLQDGRDGDDDALLEIANAYRESRPEVSRGICRLGRRQNPEEPRYPLCLARVHAAAVDFATATGWYAEAIALAPDERLIYDEALETLALFLQRRLYESDPTAARAMAREAERILNERVRRWPDEAPAVGPHEFYYVVGFLEMNAGNVSEARARFEQSLELQETPRVLQDLARLDEGIGDPETAARRYRRALDLTTGDTIQAQRERAKILERMGGAFRAANNEQADRMYEEALRIWDQLVPVLVSALEQNASMQELLPPGSDWASDATEALGLSHLRRGILLDRLRRRDDSLAAFRQAMEVAPGRQEVYAGILSHMVVSQPDVPFATEVFLDAQRESSLDPEWRVYFALWLEAISSRAGQDLGSEANAVLRAHIAEEEWHGALARFGLGELEYEELLGAAANVGQRAEAHFYEGARLLRRGDQDGARARFEQVRQTHMINFYEFTMAGELLQTN